MSAEFAALGALIDSVADGTPIDWQALDAGAASDDVRRQLRHLRLVARIAEVHGSDADDTAVGVPAPDSTGGEQRIDRWGHLLLLGKIGEGSFGEVYHARDPWLDRDVALKLLRCPAGGDAPLGRLLREARTLARIRHANVVAVHGADVHDGRVGIWMELLRGETLEDRLNTQGPLGAAEAAVVGQELCRALSAVHAAGLVHRDVKASNVMRESGGRLVLMDFGAGQMRDLAQSGPARAAGTPLYLAPELLNGDAATPQSDVYALGVLLYRLVTASYPVTAESIDGLRAAHGRRERARLRDVRPDLPDAFVAVVERALDPEAGRRFATVGEMQEALSAVAAARKEPDERRGPHLARRRLLATAAVLALALGLWQWPALKRLVAPPGIHVIAVLPLRAETGVEEYFAEGMTEALIQELSALRTIRVISHTAVTPFKGSDRSTQDIAKTLKADSLIEGSTRRSGNNVAVNVRLIHASANTASWSRTFDRAMEDVISLQRQIAREVAEVLPVVVTTASRARWSRAQTINPESYDRYLRGRAYMSEGSRAAIEHAIDLFTDAVRLDPQNSYALAGLATAHALLAGGRSATPEKTAGEARRAAQAALAIDPQSADAYAVLGEMSFFFDWDWVAADHDYRRALALNPSLEYARERYSMFLAARGRLDEALTEIEEARRVNPTSLGLVATTGALLRYARRYPEAIEQYERVLARDPQHIDANVGLGRLYSAAGQFERALTHYSRVQAREPDDSFIEGEIAQVLAGLGRRSEVLRILEQLEKDFASGARLVEPRMFAYIYASLGERDQAFKWLERALREHSIGVLWLKVDSRVDSLRNDPRFELLLRQLELP